jgi:hypothetical protein
VAAVFGSSWGVNLFGVWVRCARANAEFNATQARPYGPSVVSNPAEYVVFLGIPLGCLLVTATWRAARRVRSDGLPAAATLGLVVLLALLNVAGANRGEVARLWMLTMPLAAAAGAWWLAERRSPLWLGAVLLAFQGAQLACFRVAIEALGAWPG